MFHRDRILIVEDNVYLALDLSNAIEDCNGRVVGPVRTVAEALSLIESHELSGAVLDYHLEDRDSSPIAACLAGEGVPSSSTAAWTCHSKSPASIRASQS